MPLQAPDADRTLLLIGASRGLGYAMAAEFLGRGWNVVGSVRGGTSQTALHKLAVTHPDRVEIVTLDITEPHQLEEVRLDLAERRFGVLFVNAGIINPDGTQTIGQVSTEEFVRLMVTNALSPMRVIERLEHLVTPAGLIGVMSSGRGSIGNNETGQEELYRGSKSALNQFMRSYAARHAGDGRPMVLMAPGWVRTALGGPGARLTIEESIPSLVDVLLAKRGRPGLEYLDYLGRTVPW